MILNFSRRQEAKHYQFLSNICGVSLYTAGERTEANKATVEAASHASPAATVPQEYHTDTIGSISATPQQIVF